MAIGMPYILFRSDGPMSDVRQNLEESSAPWLSITFVTPSCPSSRNMASPSAAIIRLKRKRNEEPLPTLCTIIILI